MKIAIATENGNVAGHFGRCQTYTYYTVENNKIVDLEVLSNPGHKPGFLPNYLSDKSVDIIVSGGMGGKAQELFNAKNIKVIVGASGKTDDVAKQVVNDEIESTKSVCNDHAFRGESGENCDH